MTTFSSGFTISPEDCLGRLYEDTLWWRTPYTPKSDVVEAIFNFLVKVIFGPTTIPDILTAVSPPHAASDVVRTIYWMLSNFYMEARDPGHGMVLVRVEKYKADTLATYITYLRTIEMPLQTPLPIELLTETPAPKEAEKPPPRNKGEKPSVAPIEADYSPIFRRKINVHNRPS